MRGLVLYVVVGYRELKVSYLTISVAVSGTIWGVKSYEIFRKSYYGGGGGEYSTLERLTPTKHGRLRRVILEVYATTAHSAVFPRSQQQLLGHGKIRYATMARWPPVDGGCVN